MKSGYYSDVSKMFLVGSVTSIHRQLCEIAEHSLHLALNFVKPGLPLNFIGKEVEKFVNYHGFSVVREYCGHGIGKNFHQAPQVLHCRSTDYSCIMQPGMIFTIEPIINLGSPAVYVD